MKRLSLRRLAVLPIRLYQWTLSPVLPPSCRYHPTCSAYAIEAVLTHGIFKGSWLALRRILRCHPWSSGGYDRTSPTFFLFQPSGATGSSWTINVLFWPSPWQSPFFWRGPRWPNTWAGSSPSSAPQPLRKPRPRPLRRRRRLSRPRLPCLCSRLRPVPTSRWKPRSIPPSSTPAAASSAPLR